VAQKVAAGVYRGVTTSELDELAAETAAAMTSMHPDYALVSIIIETVPCCGARLTLTSVPAAGSKDCSVQPAQEHTQVLLDDVSGSRGKWNSLAVYTMLAGCHAVVVVGCGVQC
jgi:hypothetical protein